MIEKIPAAASILNTDLWVFGKDIDNNNIYIKCSLGQNDSNVVCISFHIAEKPLNYAFK